MSHSISCTDEDWQMICKGGERAGKKPSAWFIQCALSVSPLTGRTFPLVLDEHQQRTVVMAVGRLAQPFSGRPESLSRVEDDVRHVLRERVRAMMTRKESSGVARARLREVFGEKRAEWIEEWAQRPRQRRADADMVTWTSEVPCGAGCAVAP